MVGYIFGPRVGAAAYNVGHLYAWPVGLLATGLACHASFVTTAALSWIAHIAFDNVVGYGLKLPTGFEYTEECVGACWCAKTPSGPSVLASPRRS
jgi:hypothetical protein